MYVPQKHVIVIAGPTAVGKTEIAIRLAQHFNTQIISADSRQCYREMTIGTAKPTPEELSKVHHYFVNSNSISEELNAADYERLALGYANEIFKNKTVAVVCGGTGLYIDALCYGIDAMPPTDKAIEMQVQQGFARQGLEWLQVELKKCDPVFFENAEQQNPARLVRALAFYLTHHQSITAFRTGNKKRRDFNIIKIALTAPREILYEKINRRVDDMKQKGLLEEVNSLLPYRYLKNLHTVGYSELINYFDGKTDLPTAFNLIKQHTRNYAKRQLTWFRKSEDWQWFQPEEYDRLLQYIENIISPV